MLGRIRKRRWQKRDERCQPCEQICHSVRLENFVILANIWSWYRQLLCQRKRAHQREEEQNGVDQQLDGKTDRMECTTLGHLRTANEVTIVWEEVSRIVSYSDIGWPDGFRNFPDEIRTSPHLLQFLNYRNKHNHTSEKQRTQSRNRFCWSEILSDNSIEYIYIYISYTPWKNNNIAPENLPSPKERLVFQPSFLKGYVKLKHQGCIFIFPGEGSHRAWSKWVAPQWSWTLLINVIPL